jgi:23S rRNA (uracil1939-C5)-methyltransferase
MRAALVEVLEPSPHRVPAKCGHFGPQAHGRDACGGCTWQHIAYAEQLHLKTATVEGVMRAAVPKAPRTLPMISPTPDQPWGFRHKVHFAVANAGRRGTLLMGHLARGSRHVVPVNECPVHAEAGNAQAFALRDSFRKVGVRAWAEDDGGGTSLRGVAVRVASSGETLTTLVVAHDRDRTLRTATKRAMRTDDKGAGGQPSDSLHLNIHPEDDGFIFGPVTRCLSGRERLREEVAGVSFLISPTAFFQTNIRAAELLVRLTLDAIPPEVSVLDLYAGAGLFSLALARRGNLVTAVEGNRDAVRDGEASQRLNRIPPERCRWIARPVEAVAASLPTAGAVVLDPPRDGCARGVIDAVFGDGGPATVVYVSCNPETLGRDISGIVGHGYAVVSTQPVDMFPHTPHVETVVILRRLA